MSSRGKWLNLSVSLGVCLSFLVAGVNVATAATAKAGTGACAKSKKVSPKGTVTFSNWQFPDEFNTYQWGDLTTSVNAWYLVHESYFKYDSKARPTTVGGILAEIPTAKDGLVTNGGKTWTLKIKPGIKWSNGTEITSADIKFGFAIDSDPVTGPVCLGSCDIISRIDTPNKYTAVLHLKKAFADMLDNLPDFWPRQWPGLLNGDPHASAVKWAQDTSITCEDATQCPTDGPYQVSEWVANDRIVFTPMKYYNIDSCGATLSKVIFAFYSTKPAMIAAAASRQTDLTTNYTFADLPSLAANSGYKVVNLPAFSFEHVEFNVDPQYNGKPNPLHNANVRVALALALDKTGLIQSALGLNHSQAVASAAWTPLVVSPKLVQPYADKALRGQWDPIAKKYVSTTGTGQALKDAKKLLGVTQWKSGFSLDFYTTQGNPVRQAQEAVIASSWHKIGVTVVPNYVPAGKLFGGWADQGVIVHGSFQAVMFAYGVSPDPDFMRFLLQSKYIEREKSTHPCAVCSNNSGIHDKVFDTDLNTAAYNVNPAVRRANYYAAEIELNKLAYWVPLFYRPEIDTTDGKVGAYSPSSVNGPNWNASKWTVH